MKEKILFQMKQKRLPLKKATLHDLEATRTKYINMKQLISYRKPSFKPTYVNQLQNTLYKDNNVSAVCQWKKL